MADKKTTHILERRRKRNKLLSLQKRRQRNKSYITTFKNIGKKLINVLGSSNQEQNSMNMLSEFNSSIFHAVSKGIIAKNKASRLVSRMHKRVKLANGDIK